jgi:hypothetical protein
VERWHLEGGWLSLKSDSPRQSPNTNGFSNHYIVQWSDPVVQTSAGEPVTSAASFAVAKCSAWLVSKESPISRASRLAILKSATVSHPTLLSSSPYILAHKKHKGYKCLCSPYYTYRNVGIYVCQTAGLGRATRGQWAANSPWKLLVIRGGGINFSVLQNVQTGFGFHSVGTGSAFVTGRVAGPWDWQLHLVQKLKMGGAVSPVSLYAFMTLAEGQLYLLKSWQFKLKQCNLVFEIPSQAVVGLPSILCTSYVRIVKCIYTSLGRTLRCVSFVVISLPCCSSTLKIH